MRGTSRFVRSRTKYASLRTLSTWSFSQSFMQDAIRSDGKGGSEQGGDVCPSMLRAEDGNDERAR